CGNAPGAPAHRRQPATDRSLLRWPRPHDGHQRLPPHGAGNEARPRNPPGNHGTDKNAGTIELLSLVGRGWEKVAPRVYGEHEPLVNNVSACCSFMFTRYMKKQIRPIDSPNQPRANQRQTPPRHETNGFSTSVTKLQAATIARFNSRYSGQLTEGDRRLLLLLLKEKKQYKNHYKVHR